QLRSSMCQGISTDPAKSTFCGYSTFSGGPAYRDSLVHRGGSMVCRGAIRKSLFLAAMFALAATVAPQLRAGGKNDNAAFAQKLVDETAAKHKPQLIYLGLHGVTPHSK